MNPWTRAMARRAAAGLVALVLAGCGGGPAGGPLYEGDAQAVAAVIDDLNDAKTSAKKLAALFAPGVKPPDVKKLAPLSFYLAGKPSVDGAGETVKVRIDGAKGEQLTEAEWAFAKDGETWKIQSAPLP